MNNQSEQEAKLSEYRKYLEESNKVAKEFCQEQLNKIQTKSFDLSAFFEKLAGLNEKAFEYAIENLIREKKTFWVNLTAGELKAILEHVIASDWFKEDSPMSDFSRRDLFEVASINTSSVPVLAVLYKDYAKSQKKAGRYLATKLAFSEQGRSALVEILRLRRKITFLIQTGFTVQNTLKTEKLFFGHD